MTRQKSNVDYTIDADNYEQQKTDINDADLDEIATRVLTKHIKAFEELAKGE